MARNVQVTFKTDPETKKRLENGFRASGKPSFSQFMHDYVNQGNDQGLQAEIDRLQAENQENAEKLSRAVKNAWKFGNVDSKQLFS